MADKSAAAPQFWLAPATATISDAAVVCRKRRGGVSGAALVRKGQRVARMRADLVTDDLPRLVAMLYGVLSTMDADSDGWRRDVALVVDAISVNERQPLPPAAALRYEI